MLSSGTMQQIGSYKMQVLVYLTTLSMTVSLLLMENCNHKDKNNSNVLVLLEVN